MPHYQFVIGVSLVALQDEVNRMASEEPGFVLNEVLHVQGTGFIGVVSRDVDPAEQKRRVEAMKQPNRPKSQPSRGARR